MTTKTTRLSKRLSVAASEDVGNIIALEHLNVTVPDQSVAILFYVSGLGLTRDPYLMVGLDNMWVNVGSQQFHLPADEPQAISGHVGLVISDVKDLHRRLKSVEDALAGTRFTWSKGDGYISVTCPWGNNIRCYGPSQKFGGMPLGMPYVEFLTKPGTAEGIGEFYKQVMGAPYTLDAGTGDVIASVHVGQAQSLVFRETNESIKPYDGHHVAIYIAKMSGPYEFLGSHNLITEEMADHQFRFQQIVYPKTGEKLFELEHEVRSLYHPMYHRQLVNRDASQNLDSYVQGRDAFTPKAS